MNKTILILLLLLIVLLIGCLDQKESNINFDEFCEEYCDDLDMKMSDTTDEEKYTLNCVCEKIFLKTDWEKTYGELN